MIDLLCMYIYILFSFIFIIFIFNLFQKDLIYISVPSYVNDENSFYEFILNDFDIDDFITQIHFLSKKNNLHISNFTILKNELMPPDGTLFNYLFSYNSIHSLLNHHSVNIQFKYYFILFNFDIKLKFNHYTNNTLLDY